MGAAGGLGDCIGDCGDLGSLCAGALPFREQKAKLLEGYPHHRTVEQPQRRLAVIPADQTKLVEDFASILMVVVSVAPSRPSVIS